MILLSHTKEELLTVVIDEFFVEDGRVLSKAQVFHVGHQVLVRRPRVLVASLLLPFDQAVQQEEPLVEVEAVLPRDRPLLVVREPEAVDQGEDLLPTDVLGDLSQHHD